jgi:hypothetical protein
MCRQKSGLEGFVASFISTLEASEPMEPTDEGRDASSQAKKKRSSGRTSSGTSSTVAVSEDMAATAWVPSLEERPDAFFALLTGHLQDLWNEERDTDDKDIRSLPWPKSAAALGKDMSTRCVRDLAMSLSFGLTPPATKSAWHAFKALAQLEGVLETGGFPDFPPAAYTSRSYLSKVCFIEKCILVGSPKKRRTGIPPGSGPRNGAGGSSGAGASSSSLHTDYTRFMGWNPAGPGGHQHRPPLRRP